MKYRKKPVDVEAIRVSEALDFAQSHWRKLPQWLTDAYGHGRVLFLPKEIRIRAVGYTMTGEPGDWVVRGTDGNLFVCRSDVFLETYEEVS